MASDPQKKRQVPQAEVWSALERSAERLSSGDGAIWPAFVVKLQTVALPLLRRNWRRLDPSERHDSAEDAALDVFVRLLERLRANDYATLKRYFHPEVESASSKQSATKRRNSFVAYIKTILGRATIDHQRLDPKYKRASRAKQPGDQVDLGADRGTWISFVAAHSAVGAARDPVTLWNTAQKMLDYLDHAHQTAVDYVAQASAPEHKDQDKGQGERQLYEALAKLLRLRLSESNAGSGPDWTAARNLAERGGLYRKAMELELQGHSQVEIAEILGVSRRVVQRILEVARQLLQARFAET